MKRSKKRAKGDKKTDSKLPKRHVRLPDSGGSDETPYVRRCMSTELLQLLCLQRSLLDVADISSSRQEETPPLRSSEDTSSSSNHRHPFVNISMWSLSTKGDGVEDSQEMGLKEKNPYFLDFVDLYTKVKDFQARRCGNQPEYEAIRSVSLPSLKELPSFAHLLSKLTSYFDEDIEEFCEANVEDGLHDSNAPSYIKAFFNGDRPQDHGFGPIIPNILSDDSKKSSLNDFLSRISRDPDRCGEDCFCNKSKDLASRLQAGTSRRQDQTKASSKNKKKWPLKNKNQSSPHKKMRGRSSKSDTYRKPYSNSDRSKASRHDGKFQTSFVKSLKNNGKEQKKLLELFQLLFKKHKARERLSVISKLPKRKTLNSNQAKSKYKSHSRSGQKTLERKQGISSSKNRNVNFDDDTTKTSGQGTDSVDTGTNNIEDSSQKSTSPLNLQSNCSSPTGICKRPIPSPRKHVMDESKNAEKLQNEVFKENLVGYSGMTCSWDMTRSKFHVECSRVRDSSSTPTFQRDKDDEKLYRSNFKDGSLSNSVISPESTFCEGSSNEERELDLPLIFPRRQSPELVKERYFNCHPPKTNETSASERFWTDIMRTLRTPNKQRPVLAEFSKSKLIPGPFSASLTDLLKEKLPDLKLDGDFGTPSCYKMPSFHASLSSATSLPSGLNGSLISNKHDESSAVSEDHYSIYCPGRKDSVMGEKSLSSILTLKEEPLPPKYPSPGTLSSELFLDEYWTHNLDTSTSFDSQMNEDSLHILESKFQDGDFSAKLTETLLQATTIRDEASVQADMCKPNTTSVCIQTSDVFDRCVASTSISSLTKKSDSNSSTLMIVRQLTKPHKLISVPLSNAPLIAQVSRHQKSPESKVRRSVRIISQRRVKKVVRSPSPPVETFRSKPLQENLISDKPTEIAKNLDSSATRTRGNVYLRSMILFGDKSNKSPKLRKTRTKKLVDKNAEIRMKYFENRNKNVSFRNSSNINQNFRDGTARERNSNSNRKTKLADNGSSSTDEDVMDQCLLPILNSCASPQQTNFNANDRFSRFMNQGRFEEALEITYEKDFSVDWEDPWSGERALVCAVVKSQHEIVERLLELGSILDAPDCNGRTAFLASAIQVDHRTAWLLLSHGLEIFCAAPLKVAHGRSKDIVQFAKFLELTILSGYNPGKELKWFESVLKSNSSSNDKEKLIESTLNLLSSCKQAHSLSMSCFISIRRHLSKVNKGRSIAQSLRHLPLPKYLRSYLCMDDIM